MTNVKILDNMLEYYMKLNDDEKNVYLDVLNDEDELLYIDFLDYYIIYEYVEK